jgi:hypothetical protein
MKLPKQEKWKLPKNPQKKPNNIKALREAEYTPRLSNKPLYMQKIHVTELSKGERQLLGRKGITKKEWDSMPVTHQLEWKKEMKNPQKSDNDKWKNRQFIG